ncbi:MAG: hypothetical protein PHW64_04220 [Sulfuricurvum sp.]|nr:hypothetical protein [Sulfuricurvum sp.]
MNMKSGWQKTVVAAIGLTVMTTAAYAGLFGSDKDEYALSATPFDFAQSSSAPLEMSKDYFNSHQTESIKGVKKVIIPVFQVRFCMYDDAKKNYFSQMSAGGLTTTRSGSVEAGVEVKLSQEVREKITKRLYDQFVERLKKENVEVVDIKKYANLPEVQKAIAEVPESGTVEELSTLSGRETEVEKKKKASFFYPWAIHYPSKYNNLLFSGMMEGNVPGQSTMRVAERPNLHPSTIKIAKKLGAGIVSVGYEIRLDKMDARMESSLWDTKLIVEAAPVLRTRLLAFKVMPESGDTLMMAVGMGGGTNFTGMNFDGLGIMPISKPIFGTPKYGAFPWIDTMATYGGLTKSDSYLFHLTPDPKALESDLDKVMDAQYNLLFSMFKDAKSK